MTDVTNADRAGWALLALSDFVKHTGVDAPDEAIGDLITDLLHLAHIGGLDAEEVSKKSMLMMEAEMREDEAGEPVAIQKQLAELFAEPAWRWPRS